MITGHHSFPLLFFFFFLNVLAMPITCFADDGAPAAPPLQRQGYASSQLRNVIQALVGAGDFGGWSNFLYGIDPIILPANATLFLPSDEGLMRLSNEIDFSSALLRYHIVPRRLSFYDLLRFETGTRLPTMLLNHTILITNTSRFNFTLDGCTVIYPGIYYDLAVAAHGISCILDYSLYGVQREETLEPDGGGGDAGGLMPSEVPVTSSGEGLKQSVSPSSSSWFWRSLHSLQQSLFGAGDPEFWLSFFLILVL